METAVHNLLKETVTEHKRIIFNGNGYTDEWLKEAADRGLYNLVSTPDALPHFTDTKNKELLISHKIFTEPELYSRYEIKLENYVKTLHIESCTMAEIIQKDLIPAVCTYMAVSYTHLDVYKRQLMSFPSVSIRTRLRSPFFRSVW